MPRSRALGAPPRQMGEALLLLLSFAVVLAGALLFTNAVE
jgi:hypothetical protein